MADNATTAESFLRLGCLDYETPEPAARAAQAAAMLADDPSLATASVAAMAAVGNHRALQAELDHDPTLVDEPTGPYGWAPLLYVTYSRIADARPAWSSVDTARLLLERGADPNAGYLWHGLVPPFTALTGAFGHGERDEPAHPHGFAIATLLLEAGADPNDGQAIYNAFQTRPTPMDPAIADLLVHYGLGVDRGGPWYERFGSRLHTPAALLGFTGRR